MKEGVIEEELQKGIKVIIYTVFKKEYFTMWDHAKILKPALKSQLKGTIGGPLKLRTMLGAP